MSSSCKVEVDGIAVSEGGDGLTVTLLNLLTLEWIVKIHPDLLTIIRTEFSKELRDNVPLSSLVPRISLSIDALLIKYDKVPLAAKVNIEAHGQKEAMNVMKVKNSSYTNVTEKFNQKRSGKSKKRFCPGCFYMGNRSGAKMNFKHFPDECPRSTTKFLRLPASSVCLIVMSPFLFITRFPFTNWLYKVLRVVFSPPVLLGSGFCPTLISLFSLDKVWPFFCSFSHVFGCK